MNAPRNARPDEPSVSRHDSAVSDSTKNIQLHIIGNEPPKSQVVIDEKFFNESVVFGKGFELDAPAAKIEAVAEGNTKNLRSTKVRRIAQIYSKILKTKQFLIGS